MTKNEEIDKLQWSCKNFIQKVKVEFLSEDVERNTEKATDIARAYARGWNNCQRAILNNISDFFGKDGMI